MRLRTRVASAAVVTSAIASLGFAGSALAAPDFSGCPTTAPGVTSCLDFQSTGGTLSIGGTQVALGDSLSVRGGVKDDGTVVPTGRTGVFSTPVTIPGGIARSNSSSWLNRLTLQIKGVPAQPITFDLNSTDLTVPVKLAVKNPILGTCKLGTNANPIVLHLTTGTTNPPAPNTPITGSAGELEFFDGYVTVSPNKHVDNAFGVPAASGCNLKAFQPLLNWRLGLASPAGRNSIEVANTIAIQPL